MVALDPNNPSDTSAGIRFTTIVRNREDMSSIYDSEEGGIRRDERSILLAKLAVWYNAQAMHNIKEDERLKAPLPDGFRIGKRGISDQHLIIYQLVNDEEQRYFIVSSLIDCRSFGRELIAVKETDVSSKVQIGPGFLFNRRNGRLKYIITPSEGQEHIRH